MRLMLGPNIRDPSLLVRVKDDFDPSDFDFDVINGAWKGRFYNGFMTILGCPSGSFTSLGSMHILCDIQHRLRGDYQEVFNNFDNPDYFAPTTAPYKRAEFSDIDDDIPF